MTKEQWINQAKENQDKLVSLIKQWYPINNTRRRYLPITAPTVEMASEGIRDDIRRNTEGNPVEDFKKALEDNNLKLAYVILSNTWFGIPESTECWNLVGFTEAVDLLDDPPLSENGPEENIV